MKTVKTTLKAWPAIFLAAATLCVLTKAVAALFGIDLPEQTSLELVKNAHGWKLVKLCLYVLVAAPVLEEFIFRYLLFKLPCGLWRKIAHFEAPGRFAAIVAAASSTAFVALHYGRLNPFPDNAFVALFFFGAAQCWLCRKCGTVFSSVLNHFLFNLTNLAGLLVFDL